MIDINRHPSRSTLRLFGVLLALFALGAGSLALLRYQSREAAFFIWGLGGASALVYQLVPSTRRAIYLGWMYAALPMGWAISQLLLLVAYFLVVTPIGIVRRLVGGDALERRFERSASSYWVRREAASDVTRYTRQF